MNWLIWKQHRKMFVMLVVALALYAALVIPTGLHFWHTYQQALASCGQTNTCGQLSGQLLQSGWEGNLNPSQPSGGVNLIVLLVLALPFLLGIFVGVPLVAREYNEGTNLLIWTRSISRRKWLTAKLTWVLVATVLFAGGFALLTTWWSKTGNALYSNRFDTMKFDLQGIVPIAYAVFAVSLGVALGAWLKRIMVAIGLTMVLLIALQITIGSFVRLHYMKPQTYNASVVNRNLSPQAPSNGGASWAVGGNIVNKTGQVLSWSNPPQSCVVTNLDPNTGLMPASGASTKAAVRDGIVSRNGGPNVDLNCLDKLGYHWHVQYQPAYRYWDFQRMETALYLAFSILPLAATYWLVLKRDA